LAQESQRGNAGPYPSTRCLEFLHFEASDSLLRARAATTKRQDRQGRRTQPSNFLKDDFHRRSGFYARAGKLVDSSFPSIFPLKVEVQPLDVARIVELDTVPLARRALLPLDSFSWAII